MLLCLEDDCMEFTWTNLQASMMDTFLRYQSTLVLMWMHMNHTLSTLRCYSNYTISSCGNLYTHRSFCHTLDKLNNLPKSSRPKKK